MASPRVLKLICLVIVCTMVMVARTTNAAISCNQVVSALTPCVNYILGTGALAQGCCTGIQNIYKSAPTTADRRGVCNCLKQLAGSYSYNGRMLALAAGLPAKCGVNIPYKIDPSTDCAKVQ